jgi:hypothetical protein
MKAPSKKIWSYKVADKKFGDYIKKRDGKCQNPKCKTPDARLNCSHYWVRQHYSTRYDPQNCIALCVNCHTFSKDNWENDRKQEYYNFMVDKLGERNFAKLEKKHNKTVKRRDAILELMKWMGEK